jgi:hypothetical protein
MPQRFVISFPRLELVRCPRSLAPTLVTLPSMSLVPLAPFSFQLFRFLVICWLADGTNTSADVGPKTWPNIRLLRGLGVVHRRRRRWFGAYHHTRAVAADQRLVRLILRHFGVSANGVAP